MYLVLTALLAMNVSKSILDAFVIVNEGLERTNENFDKKNAKLIISLYLTYLILLKVKILNYKEKNNFLISFFYINYFRRDYAK
jgi:hypothetical protein